MTAPHQAKRGVRLDADEAWHFATAAHTGVFTTLRRDGMPITLPVWFVVHQRRIYLSTPIGSKKASRIRHDPRCSFLVEDGQRWAELRAVQFNGRCSIIDEVTPAASAARELMATKYEGFRTARSQMPESSARSYEKRGAHALVEMVTDERILSWDNRRLGVA